MPPSTLPLVIVDGLVLFPFAHSTVCHNGSVLRAGLISLIYGVPGVANCALTAPAADLAAAPTALPVQDTVTITEMS